ncbi:hypothetical protein JT359_13000 [Candidatus Poribacteria bacterium]|nr:hypothetical protein [Candidatus Poribacteria bacterium]
MSEFTTTRELSPVDLAKRRENLKQQWQNRQIDEKLLKRAWNEAYRVAAVLYQDYAATKVAVFGSLTEQRRFTKYSDIDIIVWGLSYNKCLDALWQTEGLSSEFKIDIINFKSTNTDFRERILSQAIYIEPVDTDPQKYIRETCNNTRDEEIYSVNREKLIQRISDEKKKIATTIDRIDRALEKIDILPVDAREFIERALAVDLAEVYPGLEKIFEQIAKNIDRHIPDGSRWHNDLLTQMSEHRDERPTVVSERSYHRLIQLLRFRHKVRNIYGDELIYAEAEKQAKEVRNLYTDVSEELDTFITFLHGI